MADDSLYQKLAKSGWLGTMPKVEANYGKWEDTGPAEPMAEALQRAKLKAKKKPDESSG